MGRIHLISVKLDQGFGKARIFETNEFSAGTPTGGTTHDGREWVVRTRGIEDERVGLDITAQPMTGPYNTQFNEEAIVFSAEDLQTGTTKVILRDRDAVAIFEIDHHKGRRL